MTTFTGPPRESGWYQVVCARSGRELDVTEFKVDMSGKWAGQIRRKPADLWLPIGLEGNPDIEWSGPIPSPFEKEEEKG